MTAASGINPGDHPYQPYSLVSLDRFRTQSPLFSTSRVSSRHDPSFSKEPPVLVPEDSWGLRVGFTLLLHAAGYFLFPSFHPSFPNTYYTSLYCSLVQLATAPTTIPSMLGWLGLGGGTAFQNSSEKVRLPSPMHVCSSPSPTETFLLSHSLRKTLRRWAGMGCLGQSCWGHTRGKQPLHQDSDAAGREGPPLLALWGRRGLPLGLLPGAGGLPTSRHLSEGPRASTSGGSSPLFLRSLHPPSFPSTAFISLMTSDT